MKEFKRFSLTILALSLTLAAAGCGLEDKPGTKDSKAAQAAPESEHYSLYSEVNGVYQYIFVVRYLKDARAIASFSSGKISNSQGKDQLLFEGTGNDMVFSPMTTARLNFIRTTFNPDPTLVSNLTQNMLNFRQVLFTRPFPAGKNTISLTFKLTDGSEVTVVDEIDPKLNVYHL